MLFPKATKLVAQKHGTYGERHKTGTAGVKDGMLIQEEFKIYYEKRGDGKREHEERKI